MLAKANKVKNKFLTMAEEPPKPEAGKSEEEKPEGEAKPEGQPIQPSPQEKKEDVETKVKLDIIKKILDDRPQPNPDGVQIVNIEGQPQGGNPEGGEAQPQIQPVEGGGEVPPGEKPNYKEIAKKSGIIGGIILGVFLIIFIGAKLSFSDEDSVEIQDVEEIKVEEHSKEVESEEESAKKIVKKEVVEEEESSEEEPEEEEDEAEEEEKTIFGKITGFISKMLDEDTSKEVDEDDEKIEEEAEEDSKLKKAFSNFISDLLK